MSKWICAENDKKKLKFVPKFLCRSSFNRFKSKSVSLKSWNCPHYQFGGQTLAKYSETQNFKFKLTLNQAIFNEIYIYLAKLSVETEVSYDIFENWRAVFIKSQYFNNSEAQKQGILKSYTV